MSHHPEVVAVSLPGGRRVDARVGRHLIQTDQPIEAGGRDSAPSPFQLFLASMGTCAGIFVQSFCAARNLPTEDVSLRLLPSFSEDGVLSAVEIDVHVPEGFPEKYLPALINVVNKCSVKRAIAAQPAFTVRTTVGAVLPLEQAS